MSAENNLLTKLSETLAYAKQQVGSTLLALKVEGNIDVSEQDMAVITKRMNLTLDKVYRDMASDFSAIKESIKNEREELKASLTNNRLQQSRPSQTIRERILSRDNK